MYANKLTHHNRLFVTIRGVIAYLMLMGVWFFYPHIQRSGSALAKEKIPPIEKKVATNRRGPAFFMTLPTHNRRKEKLVKAHPMRGFSYLLSRGVTESGLIAKSEKDVPTVTELDKINLKSGKFVTEIDR